MEGTPGGHQVKPGLTLVCFAVKEEARAFQRLIRGNAAVATAVTGMGRSNAARGARDFLDGQPVQTVLTCGFAGGLDPALKGGAVVFETAHADLAAKLAAAGAKPVKFYCADRVAATAAEKAKLRSATAADAVEMESGAIQALCRERGIPCATVRVISDAAAEDLPLDFNQLYRADMTLDFGKLAWMIAKAPGKAAALMRLQKRCQFAAGELAGVLAKVI